MTDISPWFHIVIVNGQLGIGWGLIISYLTMGCLLTGIAWHVRNEDAYWSEQMNDLRVVFDVRPGHAFFIFIAVAVVMLSALTLFVVCWPGLVLGLGLRAIRKRLTSRPQ
jgi:hypothetical protein